MVYLLKVAVEIDLDFGLIVHYKFFAYRSRKNIYTLFHRRKYSS